MSWGAAPWSAAQKEKVFKEHANQAAHNEQLLDHIRQSLGKDFFDWRITVIFYVCVHCVDAKLSEFSLKAHGHSERNAYIAWRLKNIAVDYMLLYNESINARYEPDYRNIVDETRVNEFERILGVVKAIVPATP